MIGCCGIDCSGCAAFIATREHDDVKRAEVAAEWSKMYGADITAKQIACNGCNSAGPLFHYTETMCEMRKCCIGKEHPTCAACQEYPCERLAGFFQQAPEAKNNLESMR